MTIHIEDMPFFEAHHAKGKAIIDLEAFERWLVETQGFDLLSTEDELDRAQAFKELKRGEALDLREAMEEW
jgi:erythromycin esterase-like protein